MGKRLLLTIAPLLAATAVLAAQDTAHVRAGHTLTVVVDTAIPVPPPLATVPGTVTDLAVVGTNDTVAVLQFTDVTNGAGGVASYDVRQTAGALSWGTASAVLAGTCATPLKGTAVGTLHACSVGGLKPGTSYQWQVVAFRGTLNTATAVFGWLSNVAGATTTATGAAPAPAPAPVPAPVPPAPVAGVVFASAWTSGLGSTDQAVRDGGRWDTWYTGTPSMFTVVAGGPAGYATALRVRQDGGTGPGWGEVHKYNFLAAVGVDYYLRYYFRNDDTSPAEDHIVSTTAPDNSQLIYQHTQRGASSWNLRSTVDYSLQPYPRFGWSPSAKAFANGRWYRLEFWVHWIDGAHIQFHPRVYDDAGALVAQDGDFRQDDYGAVAWNGSNVWTLQRYYAAGNSFGLGSLGPATDLLQLEFGNNGQAGAAATGLYWYFAGVAICATTWCGP